MVRTRCKMRGCEKMGAISIGEIPFFVLSAGEGNRMKKSGKNMIKPLIPLSEKLPGSLELNITALDQLKVKYIAVSLGAEFDTILSQLKKLTTLRVPLKIVDARPDYQKGPLYSFLAGLETLIPEPLIALMPADTIFHPKIYDTIKSYQFDDTYGYILYFKCDHVKENDIILITDECDTSKLIRLDYNSKLENRNNQLKENTNRDDRYKIMIPLVFLPNSFFIYAQAGLEASGFSKNKVVDFLVPYVNTTKKFRAIEISGVSTCMVDLDTKEDFEKVKDVLK